MKNTVINFFINPPLALWLGSLLISAAFLVSYFGLEATTFEQAGPGIAAIVLLIGAVASAHITGNPDKIKKLVVIFGATALMLGLFIVSFTDIREGLLIAALGSLLICLPRWITWSLEPFGE